MTSLGDRRGMEVVPRATVVANLTFHAVGEVGRALERGEAGVRVTQDLLLEVLDAVSTYIPQVPNAPRVYVCVDDGNMSDLSVVAPALAARGLSGTFFLCAGRLGLEGFLDVCGVRELTAMGMRIGSHGMNHVPWRGLSKDQLELEVRDAKAKLEDVVGESVREAACPFGEYDRRALGMLAESGFQRVYTSDRTGAREGQWLQARWSVRAKDTPESVLRFVRSAAKRSWTRTLVMAAKSWR